MKVVDTAPHLEEVERVVHELLGGKARNEGAVVERAPGKTAHARSDGGSRVLVLDVQLYQRREPEAKPPLVSLREGLPQSAIEQKAGFEIGTGGGKLKPANPIPQVELFRALLDWAKKPVEAAAQVGGLADVGLGQRVCSAQ